VLSGATLAWGCGDLPGCSAKTSRIKQHGFCIHGNIKKFILLNVQPNHHTTRKLEFCKEIKKYTEL